jgi:hypothetical protein
MGFRPSPWISFQRLSNPQLPPPPYRITKTKTFELQFRRDSLREFCPEAENNGRSARVSDLDKFAKEAILEQELMKHCN